MPEQKFTPITPEDWKRLQPGDTVVCLPEMQVLTIAEVKLLGSEVQYVSKSSRGYAFPIAYCGLYALTPETYARLHPEPAPLVPDALRPGQIWRDHEGDVRTLGERTTGGSWRTFINGAQCVAYSEENIRLFWTYLGEAEPAPQAPRVLWENDNDRIAYTEEPESRIVYELRKYDVLGNEAWFEVSGSTIVAEALRSYVLDLAKRGVI